MTRPRIYVLPDVPHLAPVVAGWWFSEWGHLVPNSTVDGWRDNMIRKQMNRETIQIVFVAVVGAEPVGACAIVNHDMATHRELSPWLSGVYTPTSQRRRGIASALVLRALDAAAGLGVTKLFLYTRHAESLYARLGWQTFSRELYQGNEVAMMSKDL